MSALFPPVALILYLTDDQFGVNVLTDLLRVRLVSCAPAVRDVPAQVIRNLEDDRIM